MLIFENPQYFWLFWLLPVLFILFLVGRYFVKRNMKRFGNSQVISQLIPLFSGYRPWIKHIMLILSFSFLIIALANPKVGTHMEEATREGIEIVVALDVSRSMLAEDIRPNRLERAKMAVSRLIDETGNDKIGIVAFAGSAVTQVPLTTDKSAAKMILRTVNTETVNVQGTTIGSAIERAVRSFSDSEDGSKVIIVVSDGENHLDCPVTAAENAAEKGINVNTIGVGTSEGAPIPIYENDEMSGYLKDSQGNTIISRYDEETLRETADAANGVFVRGTGADLGLDKIHEHIQNMETELYEEKVFAEYESRYHYFIALALIFILLEMLIFERKNKYLEKFKIF